MLEREREGGVTVVSGWSTVSIAVRFIPPLVSQLTAVTARVRDHEVVNPGGVPAGAFTAAVQEAVVMDNVIDDWVCVVMVVVVVVVVVCVCVAGVTDVHRGEGGQRYTETQRGVRVSEWHRVRADGWTMNAYRM